MRYEHLDKRTDRKKSYRVASIIWKVYYDEILTYKQLKTRTNHPKWFLQSDVDTKISKTDNQGWKYLSKTHKVVSQDMHNTIIFFKKYAFINV